MIKLFLDTSEAKRAKVTITDNEKTLSQVEGDEPLITIKEAVEKVGLSMGQIDKFSAHRGPGSYTGIRIGLAIANALNFAFGKEVDFQEAKYQ